MKTTFNNIIVIIILFFSIIGCSKDSYLTDEGIHNPNITVSKVEYLEANNWKLFDTIVLLIDHYDMRAEVNSAPTFFAVTDFAFGQNTSLENIFETYSADDIRAYIFNKKITLKELENRGQPEQVTSVSGDLFQAFIRTNNDYYVGVRWSSVEPHFLYISKINGEIDSGDISQIPNEERDIDVRMQTQGIIDPEGNMLHVMSNLHNFGY